MKLRMLKTHAADDQVDNPRSRGALRVVDGSTQIIEWPFPASESKTLGNVEVKAEVQAKRFHDRSVDSERYTATVRANDNSPYALLAALVEACGGIEEFRQSGAPGDQIILQISLRS
jgi:hypothetical protein